MRSYPSNEDAFPAELKRLRRMFHKNPEIGFAEFWTTARICEYLSQLNCDLLYGDKLYNDFPEPELLKKWDNAIYESAKEQYKDDEWIPRLDGRTGLVAIIKGKKDGPKVCFRFDIDGLPIEESNEEDHIPFMKGFNSANRNMHACGHDGHIAIGLGLAKKMSENAEALNGTCCILFQPAEEMISGGKIFSKLGIIKDLNYFMPVHIGLIGQRKVVCGVSFLEDKRYEILFRGRRSHAGASPDQGRNALAAACSAVTGLYGISRHGGGRSRINIGKFISENASNIISDKAQFELDLRGETAEICEYLTQRAYSIIHGASIMYDVEDEIDFITEAETAVNSAELTALVRNVCLDAGFEKNDIIDKHLVPGSEDATFIMNAVINNGGLSTYICIGSPTSGGHHHEKFDFDEDILFQGVNLLHKIAIKLSEREPGSTS
jgi:aminobenzoyl-glutamate utilization protein A